MAFGVEATDGSGFARNGLVFATKQEADLYARDLFVRWLGCKEARSIEVDEPVNYRVKECDAFTCERIDVEVA